MDNASTSNWGLAAERLNQSLIQCGMLGSPGLEKLQKFIVPLLMRYNSGEKTDQLYADIMRLRIQAKRSGHQKQ